MPLKQDNMKPFIFFFTVLFSFTLQGQQRITLEQCYNLLETNYPLIKQHALLEKQNQLDSKAINNTKLPQLNLEAQATYQSDVTEVPLPNSPIEPLNKDQYRATLSINQLIYNGGLTDASLKMKASQLETKQKQIDVSMYQLKQQINQLYFSILLTQETRLLLDAKKTQLQTKLDEVKSGVKYGVLLPASDSVLETELLKIEQQFIEVESSRVTLIETLSNLIGQSLAESASFEKPLIETQLQTEINRPELELFQYKKQEVENSEELIARQNLPKLNGFATGGYGNPGLNMLDNSFQPFYLLGLKLSWNVFDWNIKKTQREALAVNKDIIDNETEIFKLNTSIELNKQQKEIEKISAFIASDLKIVDLQKKVLETVDSQLKNGVITSSTYMTEFTNLFEDENTLVRHEIQLELAKANYNTIQGH